MRAPVVLLLARPAAVLLGLMTAVILGQTLTAEGTGPDRADRPSFVVARDLFRATTSAEFAPPREPHLRAPGYPLIVAALAHVDPKVAEGLDCAGKYPSGCGTDFPFVSLLVAQGLAVSLALVLVYRLALRLAQSRQVALIALVLTFVGGRFGSFAGELLSYSWYGLGVVASVYLLVPAGKRLTAQRTFAAGAVIGFTSLFEPTFFAALPVAALLIANAPRDGPMRLGAAASLLAGGALSILSVLLVADARGYDLGGVARQVSWHLAERVAFNRLEGPACWAALLLPTPILGPLLAVAFPPEIVDSFGNYIPGTYVFEGATRILPTALAQPGGPWGQLFWLARTHVLGDLSAYLSTVAALLLRGLWGAAGLIGLVGIFHLPTLMRWSRTGPRYDATLRVIVLGVALLIVNSLLTANPVHINPMLAFIYAYAIAYVAGGT